MPGKSPTRLRIEAGYINQKMLADNADVSAHTLRKYETGKLHVIAKGTFKRWARIAKLLKITYQEYSSAVLDQRWRALKK
ncbi:MAG: helix-turn-helix transcriptional regulator [Sterolibacterium sp.]